MYNYRALFAVIGLVSLLFLGTCFSTCVSLATERVVTVTITEKNRVHYSKSSYWLLFAEDDDGNLYELTNTDHLVWYFKTNSSSIQNQLKQGKKYELLVGGPRITWLSWYPNILSVNREVPTSNQNILNTQVPSQPAKQRLLNWALRNEDDPDNSEAAEYILSQLE